ncbi:cellulase family glycosylhydrolase [uncultured Bacteroides sp.]|uniref:cellulase family glycosylhydrolase n=1 Tax=uncultured Bacteroides sp. TaxID=162156 RepID=UPI002AAB7D4C|nr:cellulase family glycosylhydrolase [uncultured Bacteroides sp.]
MRYLSPLVLMLLMVLFSCSKSETEINPELVLTKEALTLAKGSGTTLLAIQSNVPWTASSSQSWCTSTPSSGEAGEKQINVSVTENTTNDKRDAIITITAGSLSKQVKVIQAGKDMTIPADKTGMESDALVLARKMYLGWNLGNALECTGSAITGSASSGETDWGNAIVTKVMIDAVKVAGFNAVRIPCAWNRYLENTTNYKIKDFWLARVKQVVDYCVSNDMYAILNIHWDGGWLDNNPTLAKQTEVTKKEKALWEQIAVYFRNYDEHLLFAGTNEVNMGDAGGTPTQDNYNVQMSYNQTFVDAVRSTGGKNAYRNLIIQAFCTNIDQAVSYLKVSTDKVQNRLMVEVHYYDPWQFCGMEKDETWGKYAALWGADYKQYATGSLAGRAATWGEEEYVRAQFAKMKTNFVDKGYPVILGEYSPTRRLSFTGDALTYHLDSRAYYLKYETEQAKNYGIVPFYWDNGGTGDKGCGIFNRSTTEVVDTKALNGLVQGASAGKYPF